LAILASSWAKVQVVWCWYLASITCIATV